MNSEAMVITHDENAPAHMPEQHRAQLLQQFQQLEQERRELVQQRRNYAQNVIIEIADKSRKSQVFSCRVQR